MSIFDKNDDELENDDGKLEEAQHTFMVDYKFNLNHPNIENCDHVALAIK